MRYRWTLVAALAVVLVMPVQALAETGANVQVVWAHTGQPMASTILANAPMPPSGASAGNDWYDAASGYRTAGFSYTGQFFWHQGYGTVSEPMLVEDTRLIDQASYDCVDSAVPEIAQEPSGGSCRVGGAY